MPDHLAFIFIYLIHMYMYIGGYAFACMLTCACVCVCLCAHGGQNTISSVIPQVLAFLLILGLLLAWS